MILFFQFFSRLVIKVPWFNIWSKSTEIEIDGLHLLVVPSTSVRYDEKNERKIQFEAKQKRLQKAEDLKLLNVSNQNDASNNKTSADDQNDPFFERLAKTIIKNLEVTITNVHIRYEKSVILELSVSWYRITEGNDTIKVKRF